MFDAVKVFVVALSVSGAALTSAHADEVRDQLFAALTGEFDSAAQMAAEKAVGTPEDMQHGHVYRSYTAVDAPALGEPVLVGTVRYGGRDGSFDDNEFLLWSLQANSAGDGYVLSPQKFKDPEAFIPISRDAQALAKLTPDDLVPATGAAGCDVFWREESGVFVGATDGEACVQRSYIQEKDLSWHWTYVLSDDGLWLSYAGKDETGDIVNGRPDQLPWLLSRVD